MSLDRKKALQMVDNDSEALTIHVIMCCIWGNKFGCLKHWVNSEISNYIVNASEITVKNRKGRLKESEYMDTLFGFFGESKQDARNAINSFKRTIEEKEGNTFDVTEELVDNTYYLFKNIRIKYASTISSMNVNDSLSRNEVSSYIFNLLSDCDIAL